MDIQVLQWALLVLASIALFLISPRAKTGRDFFFGESSPKTGEARQPGFWLLMSSLVISWIFAKSITNAANLGLAFGFVGGFAYAIYYLSFFVAGVVIYQLRTKGGYKSIHHFLESKYGKGALILFSLLIGFRLFNEVWSNTMVIGTYFGDKGSTPYLVAIIVFTLLTLAYSLKGGMRSSLLTDLIQMLLFGFLLAIILGVLLPKENGDVTKFVTSGEWKMSTGLNLLFVALIQVFSYPFHDPVLTDRGFISNPKTTLKSFFWAVPLGMLCIILFSFVGIYAKFNGLEGQAAVEVGKVVGIPAMLLMNFIMVTSAASTLDSTFSSFSKLVNIDLKWAGNELSISKGRLSMIAITILGTIPVFLGPEILSATTVSGTMVIGLAPIFLFWNKSVPRWTFTVTVGTGVVFGLLFSAKMYPENLLWFDGKYGDLLSVNILGSFACFAVFLLACLIDRLRL